MKNVFKIGIMGGIFVTANNTVANAGIDLAYQNLVMPHVGIGLATGYNHFFGKENKINTTTLMNNDLGVVPVAVLFRYYPNAGGIYIGADMGYGFINGGDEKVVEKGSYNADSVVADFI